jgi:hypothetical protein
MNHGAFGNPNTNNRARNDSLQPVAPSRFPNDNINIAPRVPVDPYEYERRVRDESLKKQLLEIEKIIPDSKRSSFASLEFRPRHIRFATQNKGEKVYLLIRRHWITNLGWFLQYTFMAILPAIFVYILNVFNISTDLVTPRATFLILLGYYSIIVTNFFSNFFDWYFDPYILTSERIIGYDFKPFTSYSITEATLDNIEDVREKSVGPIANLFHFGTIRILTASEKGEILFEAVPNPTEVRDIIADVANIYKKYHYNSNDD